MASLSLCLVFKSTRQPALLTSPPCLLSCVHLSLLPPLIRGDHSSGQLYNAKIIYSHWIFVNVSYCSVNPTPRTVIKTQPQKDQ